MHTFKYASAVAAALAAVCAGQPGLAAETCEELSVELQALDETAAADELAAVFDAALALPDCSDDFLLSLGRRAASATYREVNEAIEQGADPAMFVRRLEASLVQYRLWQTLATLGDIAFGRRDYAGASQRYQEALEAIDDEELTRTAPDVDLIAAIYSRAEETRLVAAEYVSLPQFRDGRPRALSDPDIRGFQPAAIAWPITFLSGSTDLTDKARAAIDDLWLQMSYEDFPPITLVGYTDTRGSRSANQRLSRRRAEAVANYLREKGYTGEIAVDGRGENEIYEPLDASHYTEDELLLMNRRVDLVR